MITNLRNEKKKKTIFVYPENNRLTLIQMSGRKLRIHGREF